MEVVAKKRVLLLVCILVLGMIFTIVAVKLDLGKLINSNHNVTVQQVETANVQLNEMFSANTIDNTKIDFTKTNMLETNPNLMSLSDFIALTNDTYDAENNCVFHDDFSAFLDDNILKVIGETKYIEFELLATSLGYSFSLNGNEEYTVERKYATKRLIVDSIETLKNTYSATNVLKIDDYQILQYASEKQTMIAYNNFVNDQILVSVDTKFVNQEVKDYDLQEATPSTQKANTYGSFNSWGGAKMGFSDYNTYLLSKYNKLSEKIVVVMDTGINPNHILFKDRIAEGSIAICSGYTSAQWKDDKGHGTHVSGTIAELTTPNVKIISVKVLNSMGAGYSSFLRLGFTYVLSLINQGKNICAINCSFGSDLPIKTINIPTESVIEKIIDKGVAVCVSAGNESTDINNTSPACVSRAITVSAISSEMLFASYSNYGNGVDFCAPGTNIKSASYTSASDVCNLSGTSMAAPHITAVFAMLASDPENNYTLDQMITVLKTQCAIDLGEPGFDVKYGWGYIDLSKLVGEVGEDKLSTYDIAFEIVENMQIESEQDDEIQYQVLGKARLSYYDSKNNIKEFVLSTTNSRRVSTITTSGSIILEAKAKNGYKFIGWVIDESGEYNAQTPVSTDSVYKPNDLNIDGYNSIFAVFERIEVATTFSFIYTDKAEYTGFGSYGIRAEIEYYDKTKKEFCSYEFVCGYRASDQVFTLNIASNSYVNIKLYAENDSVVNYLYYNGSMNSFKKTNVEYNYYIVEKSVTDCTQSIVISVLI